ncbi:MAG TPA: hypothetical protein VFA33_21775 [Bryobacteraceae bacterium]|nr:hypothetical protein [Bryobacteraceae bacterium]
MDSRNYIVAFDLQSAADCPRDFRLPHAAASFDAGIFLPRDDPDWFGRSAYPPRVLLLGASAFWAIAHPRANEIPRHCEIERISSVASGHMLLKGWLDFRGAGFPSTIPYNTRGLPAVLRFMRRFRSRWLGAAEQADAPQAALGDELDTRFANALADELDPGESVAARFFQRPRGFRRRWPLQGTRWTPGNLLVNTGSRLIWVTDRYRGSRLQYGRIASYAPLRTVQDLRVAPHENEWHVQVDVAGEVSWLIPVAGERRREAEQFAMLVKVRSLRSILRT